MLPLLALSGCTVIQCTFGGHKTEGKTVQLRLSKAACRHSSRAQCPFGRCKLVGWPPEEQHQCMPFCCQRVLACSSCAGDATSSTAAVCCCGTWPCPSRPTLHSCNIHRSLVRLRGQWPHKQCSGPTEWMESTWVRREGTGGGTKKSRRPRRGRREESMMKAEECSKCVAGRWGGVRPARCQACFDRAAGQRRTDRQICRRPVSACAALSVAPPPSGTPHNEVGAGGERELLWGKGPWRSASSWQQPRRREWAGRRPLESASSEQQLRRRGRAASQPAGSAGSELGRHPLLDRVHAVEPCA